MFTLKRDNFDRRSGKDRRKNFSVYRLFHKGPDRRMSQDRRTQEERRDGWVRISRWSSAYLPDLKIAKYLR